MDHYGIGTALLGAFHILQRTSRGTGRTTSMIDSVKDGDRICFAHAQEAARVRRELEERGLNVECIVVSPSTPEKVFERGTAQGRLLFDHVWVEDFYQRAIEQAMKDVASLQNVCSGYGEAHRETRRRAAEIARWKL